LIGVLDITTDTILATIVGAVISAVVSIVVAGFFGERAATNFSIRYRTKREHDRSLVVAPLEEIIGELGGFEGAMSVGVNWFKDGVLQVNVLTRLEKGEKRETTEKDLLITHLETGYPEIFNHLKDFREQYNANSKSIATISNEVWNWLKEPALLPPYSIKKSMQTEYCNYEQSVSIFVNEAFQEWKREREITGRPVVKNQTERGTIYYTVEWQMQIAHTIDNPTAVKMRERLDGLVGSEFHDSLIAIFNDNLRLKEKSETIKRELQILRVKVNAGVPLEGSCSAGQEAKPRFE
jgi:hypothetical protein